MKYFILRQNIFFSDRFYLEGWQRKINSKWICFRDFHKIPPRNVLEVILKDNIPFPDIVTTPFLFMSNLMINVAEIYGESVYKRDIVVVDRKKCQNKHYCLTLLETLGHGHIFLGESNLFYMWINGQKEIVVSRNFAESVLRRGVVGIMLEEIDINEEVLYGK